MELTKASLLSRVRDPGDQRSWRDFERTYRELILRYCAARGLQPADREDVLQRCLLKLMRSLPKFSYDPERGRFRNYLLRVVRSAIADHTVRSAPAAGISLMDDIDLAGDAQEALSGAAWHQEWMGHHFRLALSSIRSSFDPRSISIFNRLLDGAAVDLVAREFATTPAAVHKVKQRVRDRLAELIRLQIQSEDLV